jgi:putative phosphoesterase
VKLFICSDIHGDAECLEKIIAKFHEEKADKMLILGDILYHGPRNELPSGYAPKRVIAMLSELTDKIIAVRGNCDTEVDQMVLPFPILSDYSYILIDGLTLMATHGHKFSPEAPPPLSKGDILLGGHTHVLKIEPFGNGNLYVNPGSASIPKENNPKSYAIYENKTFVIKDLDGKVIKEKSL